MFQYVLQCQLQDLHSKEIRLGSPCSSVRLQCAFPYVFHSLLQCVLQYVLQHVLQCVLQCRDDVACVARIAQLEKKSSRSDSYGVATISKLLKIIGLFCKRAL